jgi:hypothetical protein
MSMHLFGEGLRKDGFFGMVLTSLCYGTTQLWVAFYVAGYHDNVLIARGACEGQTEDRAWMMRKTTLGEPQMRKEARNLRAPSAALPFLRPER